MQTSAVAVGRGALPKAVECSMQTSAPMAQHRGLYKLPSLRQFSLVARMRCSATQQRRLTRQSEIVATYPEPETEKERSPIDFPQEWITPQPSRRPDIFPEFERLDTPLPKPLPGDPEMPDEEEEEEEEKKKKNPDEPEKEDEPKPDEPAPAQE